MMESTDAILLATSNQPSRRRWVWPTLTLGIILWQGWLTLGLLGFEWQAWSDDQPILSGNHPQHLYLGTLGAQAQHHHGSSCAYDPAFYVGYPKTPVFNACRWGELFLYLGGGAYQPGIYKLGLAVASLLAPLLISLAARAAGLSAAASFWAMVAGLLVWWGPLGRMILESGDLDLMLASLAVLAHLGFLIRFDRKPGLLTWIGLLTTGCLGWFCQPLLFPIVLPLLLIYYLSVGVRHSSFTWHLTLGLAEIGGLLINLPWLLDWIGYWWVRSPLPTNTAILPHRTLHTLWTAPLWGGDLDRALALFLMGSGLAGTTVLNFARRRTAARLLGLSATSLFVLAILGITWAPLGDMGTAALLAPALVFAALPAAHAWTWLTGALADLGGWGRSLLAILATAVAITFLWTADAAYALAQRLWSVEPLVLGLGPEREELVRSLIEHTSTDARILWEDAPRTRPTARWSALLPLLTGRSFLGGLDSEGVIEHAKIGLLDQALDSKPIASWSDSELEDYCRRYNIGWIVAWSPAAIQRFSNWPGARSICSLTDVQPGQLFALKQSARSFALKGQARLIQADSTRLTLADVVPEDGVVILSLHYQKGLRATPHRVQVEREPCGCDPIGFLRLRVAGPVARVTLTWER